jgi:hypothetical protein
LDETTGGLRSGDSEVTGRMGALATTLLDGRVLVAGGVNGGPDRLTSAELYQP